MMFLRRILIGALIVPLVGCEIVAGADPDPAPQPATPAQPQTTLYVDVTDPWSDPATSVAGMDAAVGDLDGDGDMDLAIAVEFGPNLLLMNDGSGHLVVEPGGFGASRRDSEEVVLADIDGDGDLDVFFASEDDQTNQLFINEGSGRFRDRSEWVPVAGTTNAAVATDLDGDGLDDLILGNAGSNQVLMSRGDAFEPVGGIWFANSDGRTTQDLELGDIDGDGDLDLIEANEDGTRVWVRVAVGFVDETHARLPAVATEETREADLADIDGDGDLDLYLANVAFRPGARPEDRLLVNDGNGHFGPTSLLPPAAENSLDAEFVDVDWDGDLDLVVALFPGLARAYLQDPEGRFVPTIVLPGTWPTGQGLDLERADLDGDGRDELYVVDRNGVDRIFRLRDPAR